MTYPLEALVRVRRMREEAAACIARQRQDELLQAEQALAAAAKDRREYAAWRREACTKKFGEARGKIQKLSQLASLQVAFEHMLGQENARVEKEVQAANRHGESHAAFEQARSGYRAAATRVKKLEQHREGWEKIERREQERREENELDELSSHRRRPAS